MRAPIELPKVGDSAFEGIVGRWLKAVGEQVEEFEPIVEIEGDKAIVEMPSPASGRLVEIVVPSGQRVGVGTVIGIVADEAEPEDARLPAAPAQVGVVAGEPEPEGSRPAPAPDPRASDPVPSTSSGRTVPVLLPKVGDSAFEGTIARWLKAPGDEVEEFEPLVEIEGDKAIVEMPSPASGRLLEILVPVGTRVAVESTIALIATDASASDDAPAAQRAARPMRASRLAARMAAQHGLDLNALAPSEPGSRLTAREVRRHLELRAGKPSPPPAAQPAPHPHVAEGALTPAVASGSRQAIAEHMLRSWLTIPHGSVTALADVANLVRYRKAHPDITFTPFFAAALVGALQTCPWMLPAGEGVHLGIAVAMKGMLLVPVLHGPDASDFDTFASAVEDLVARARAGRLRPEELSGGNFSLTNVGTFGALHSQPIIPERHRGILGVGAVEPRATAREGYLAVRPSVYLSAVVDRRFLDEQLAGRFLAEVLRHLEAFA
jgi:2-oxoglutarate dehydrogenase E2 component (dihydrolipoamide succinyltransferase)